MRFTVARGWSARTAPGSTLSGSDMHTVDIGGAGDPLRAIPGIARGELIGVREREGARLARRGIALDAAEVRVYAGSYGGPVVFSERANVREAQRAENTLAAHIVREWRARQRFYHFDGIKPGRHFRDYRAAGSDERRASAACSAAFRAVDELPGACYGRAARRAEVVIAKLREVSR